MLLSEKSHAISAINCLATHGSILSEFVGAVCRINMSLLAHKEQTIRTQACDFLLHPVLWNRVRHIILLAGDKVIDSRSLASSQ